jgi:hypothetical protein
MAKPSAVNHVRMVSTVVAVEGLPPHTSMPRSHEWGFCLGGSVVSPGGDVNPPGCGVSEYQNPSHAL